MRKGPVILAVVLALVIAGAIFWYSSWQHQPARQEGAPPAPLSGGQAAPPFTLPDVNGNRIDSALFQGKATVINFFATWCPPCRQEIPGFVAVHNKYRDRGFELVGISLDTDTKANLPGFITENKIGYRILFGDLATAKAYGGVSSIPTTFFVGKDGTIRNVHVGFMDQAAFDQEVRKLL